jgi:hypothetical protein
MPSCPLEEVVTPMVATRPLDTGISRKLLSEAEQAPRAAKENRAGPGQQSSN